MTYVNKVAVIFAYPFYMLSIYLLIYLAIYLSIHLSTYIANKFYMHKKSSKLLVSLKIIHCIVIPLKIIVVFFISGKMEMSTKNY